MSAKKRIVGISTIIMKRLAQKFKHNMQTTFDARSDHVGLGFRRSNSDFRLLSSRKQVKVKVKAVYSSQSTSTSPLREPACHMGSHRYPYSTSMPCLRQIWLGLLLQGGLRLCHCSKFVRIAWFDGRQCAIAYTCRHRLPQSNVKLCIFCLLHVSPLLNALLPARLWCYIASISATYIDDDVVVTSLNGIDVRRRQIEVVE